MRSVSPLRSPPWKWPAGSKAFLQRKWGAEKAAHEQAALDAFFARTGYPRTPRYHLVKWLTDWVRAYGIKNGQHPKRGARLAVGKHSIRC